jgi:OmpA-OmpF porin, OOP family
VPTAIAAVLLASSVSGVAGAQDNPHQTGQFSVQNFLPAIGPHNYFTTQGVRVTGQYDWSASLLANYALKPFVVRACKSQTDCEGADREDVSVVENMVTGDFMGSFNPIDILQVGLRLPLTYSEGHGLSPEGLPTSDGLSAFGVGDMEIAAKARLHGKVKDPFVVGASVFGTVPFGQWTANDKYIGDGGVDVGGAAIFDGQEGPFSFGGNLGGVYRPSARIGSTNVGSELLFSVAGGYKVSPVLRLIADLFGSTRFSTESGSGGLEIDVGAQIRPLSSPIVITAGAGTGILQGIGVPTFRGFAGFMYIHEPRDRDDDGIVDNADQCPTVAEDVDGYEDSDGCPDADNDLDTIPDSADKCPNEAEDPDGFEDIDGCPERDNDKDGVPDEQDRCPSKAETKNGYKDEDGCPDEPDRDEDGIPDTKDKCPEVAEDTDGFEDLDGCPEVDNDKDGIPDNDDECLNEPETKNGFEDEDGCPDKKP